MERRALLRLLLVAAATGMTGYFLGRPRPSAIASSDGMMGGGMMDMMAPGNMSGPMRTGMALFQRHNQVRRSVTTLPNGIRAVSESDDPQTAELLTEHVASMYQRLDEEQSFPYPMSRSVSALFAKSTQYHRKLERLPRGIAVTETSEDPQMVALIHAHAREIDGFVADGMPAMMRGMMQ
jgi:hypothetical protein